VERQLKERLIGATVLVAIAVIMVPEMFSGPHSHTEVPAESASLSSGQIKTYHIELQSARSSEAQAAPPVDEPVAYAREETPANTPETVAPESNGSSSSSIAASSVLRVTPASSSSSGPASSQNSKSSLKPKPEAIVEVPSKPSASNKPEGEWVVQVGSFGAEDKARQIVAKLKSQGHAAYVGKITVTGKTLYRVRVGALPSRAAADAALRKITATYPGASVVPANR
jgi:DedD protein